jgi:hypothetical protein
MQIDSTAPFRGKVSLLQPSWTSDPAYSYLRAYVARVPDPVPVSGASVLRTSSSFIRYCSEYARMASTQFVVWLAFADSPTVETVPMIRW